MDMPGRGPHDERDSGIARSGTLMRLTAQAWIDLHSVLHPSFTLNSMEELNLDSQKHLKLGGFLKIFTTLRCQQKDIFR